MKCDHGYELKPGQIIVSCPGVEKGCGQYDARKLSERLGSCHHIILELERNNPAVQESLKKERITNCRAYDVSLDNSFPVTQRISP